MSDSIVTGSDSEVVVCSRLNPFTTEKIDHVFIKGMTVKEILEKVGMPGHVSYFVTIDGVPVLPEDYANVIPAEGSFVSIRAVPTGGGGKNIFRTILTIVVVVVASVVSLGIAGAPSAIGLLGATGASIAGALAGAAIMTVGMLIVNAIAPPATPDPASFSALGDLGGFSGGSVGGIASSGGAAKPSYALSAANNPLVPYGVIPMLLGRHRISPPYGARPFTTNEGDDQYLQVLFCEGYGLIFMADHRLGETPIDNFLDLEMEVFNGDNSDNSTLFPSDVFQQDESIILKQVEGWAVRETQPNTNRISVDITYPNGLMKLNDDGSTDTIAGEVDIQYRLKGTTEWIGETHTVDA